MTMTMADAIVLEKGQHTGSKSAVYPPLNITSDTATMPKSLS